MKLWLKSYSTTLKSKEARECQQQNVDVWENVTEVEIPEVLGAKRYVNLERESPSPGFKEEYLRELLRAEGRTGVDVEQCPTCASVAAEDQDWDAMLVIKCDECGAAYAFALHQGTFFEDSMLIEHGLRVQLEHTTMKLPWTSVVALTVFPYEFNASGLTGIQRPWSCATMEVLKHFHTLMLARKVSAYEYYRGLNHMMDNTKVDLSKGTHSEWYRNDGDWKTTMPKEEKFVHRPVLAVDANFRMSSHDTSSVEADPGLHMGLAYFVDHEDYLAHVQKYTSQKDPGVAQTNGKGVEWTWDDMNTCTSSMKEMGPRARHDTINDQFGGHNWRKITSTGDLLHVKLEQATVQVAKQLAVHIAFTESLLMDKRWAQEWTRLVEAWESNYKASNPYFKEAKSASIGMGLLIEDTQSDVEHKSMMLPSALTVDQRMEGCKSGVVKIEEDLCKAQCLDALDVVQGIIQVQCDSYAYCDRNIAIVKYNTVRAALLCLRGARDWEKKLRVLTKANVSNIEGAVFTIDDGTEPDTICYCKKKTATQQVVAEGEGFQAVSWIWTMEGSFDGMEDKEMNTVVCVEWLKSHAWMLQWCEELLMVKTEMRRILLSLERNASDWEG
ncbi:hypothetical protein ARMGADRAFT_1038449 [Armillaria gallica]|uniref:CxC2-like cysteine cluster KDZ transposase-associated domain-containing protein n=1 Tax=Armillaria gallica TaxID=47427 RepID=A0A2H3CHW6_ARMGA|nr:hypothetical protein ARMGADRAFT_1038449 [Armillaria gallica]